MIWYGGKPYKQASNESTAPKVNGTRKDDPMVIDLDDDDEPDQPQIHSTPVEFEDEEEEVDPSAPYRSVRRYVDVPLGTSAMRIAVPHIPLDLSQAPPDAYPPEYLDRILVAAACADYSIQLVSLPISPPSPAITDISAMDVQTLKLFGSNSHQALISSIAITHSPDVVEQDEEVDGLPPSRSRSRGRTAGQSNGGQWSLLIASASCTGTGLLLVHQIPLADLRSKPRNPSHLRPIRRQPFRCSLMGAKLSFNTTSYPAERYSNLLITLPHASCAKVFQVFPRGHSIRGRRGSTATADSGSSTQSLRASSIRDGKVLITLLPPFAEQDPSDLIQRRKRVLDAKWIAGGRAIIALLEDGEWGIWDVEAVGPVSSSSPSSTNKNLIRGQGNVSGIHGGALTRFAVRSSVFPAGEAAIKSINNSSHQPTSGSLAPMTPHSRKVRSEGLFQGTKHDDGSLATPRAHGAIHVTELAASKANDDSAVLSYGGDYVYISSVLSFWRSEAAGRGSLDASLISRPKRLPTVRLGGQQPHTILLLGQPSGLRTGGLFGTTNSTPDFLVATSNRLILFMAPLTESPADRSNDQSKVANPLATNLSTDQVLLNQGELDVEGMDRILDGMATNGTAKGKTMSVFGKSVGFRLDDDVDMSSPTPGPRTRRKLVARGRAADTPRRLFT